MNISSLLCSPNVTVERGFGLEGLSAEFWGQAPLMLVLAAVIVFLFPRMSDGQGLPIRGFGAMVVLAVVAGAGLALVRAR